MEKQKGKLVMVIEKTDTGYSAFAEDYPIFTTGRTIVELMANALEAANLAWEEEGLVFAPQNLKFEIDFQQFFQYYKVLNANVLAEKIGMNPSLDRKSTRLNSSHV